MMKNLRKMLSVIIILCIIFSSFIIVKADDTSLEKFDVTLSQGLKKENKIIFKINLPNGAGLRGDVNNNGKVSESKEYEYFNDRTGKTILKEENIDAHTLQEALADLIDKNKINENLADFNCDGKLDITDASMIGTSATNGVIKKPITLSGSIAEECSYELVKGADGNYSVEVTIPAGTKAGTIGVTLHEGVFKNEEGENKQDKINKEASTTMFEVKEIEDLKVLDVKKDPSTENAEKVIVTITVNKELDSTKIPDGWTLSEDKKSISKEFNKNGKEDVTLTDKDGNTIKQTVEVSNIKDGNGDNKEEFKVINKTEEDQGNGKIKVTVTVNKELDPTKIPDGWTLSEDGKSIWKVMDKGASEDLTLIAKDGSTIKYTVTAGDKTTAPGKIPQTGVKNTIIVVVAGIAIVGTVVFIRTRKMLK